MTIKDRVLTVADFPEFFSTLNNGHSPFTWQTELVKQILETGEWPDQLAVPTGGGKASVVDIHVFVNACSLHLGVRVPRRLHVVVNRRALVDSQYAKAVKIARQLESATEADGVIFAAAQALRALRIGSESSPLMVGHLRGNLSDRILPIEDPSSVAVVAATPDMWGSRLLFRGYGSKIHARPRETGVLAFDSVMVLDEAHLNRQLLSTSRRVRELQKLNPEINIPVLQVMETTATPTESLQTDFKRIDVQFGELESDANALLKKRFLAVKDFEYVSCPKWTGKPGNKPVVEEVLKRCLMLQQESRGTVGCIVNHVETALKVTQILRKQGLTVELLVGRMRPADVESLQTRRPGIFEPQGNPDVDVVVSTQTLEVGIDANFRHLITELAPGTALVQRFGRCNRLGDFGDSTVVILGPNEVDAITKDFPPYTRAELVSAYGWLKQLEALGGSVNPRAVAECVAPHAELRRPALTRLEEMNVQMLAKTNANTAAEPDLDLWLSDSLEAERGTAGIVVRENLPIDDAAALGLLRTLLPKEREVFPTNIRVANQIKETLVIDENSRFRMESRTTKTSVVNHYRAFIYRNGEVTQALVEDRLRPGDILIIDQGLPVTTEGVVSEDPTDKTAPAEVCDPNVRRIVVANAEMDREEGVLLSKLAGLSQSEVRELWDSEGFAGKPVVSKGVIEIAGRTLAPWCVVFETDLPSGDNDILQEWTVSEGKVHLNDHQRDVAGRVEELAKKLGLSDALINVLTIAALHHDDGKADARFQRMLGAKADEEFLAKSEKRTQVEVRLAKEASSLPQGWRHEQYSALLVHELLEMNSDQSRLIQHLVGTSHGRGRPLFPMVANDLIADSTDYAEALFTQGGWDQQFEYLNRSHGAYQMAYLESLLRAADGQISKEGR